MHVELMYTVGRLLAITIAVLSPSCAHAPQIANGAFPSSCMGIPSFKYCAGYVMAVGVMSAALPPNNKWCFRLVASA